MKNDIIGIAGEAIEKGEVVQINLSDGEVTSDKIIIDPSFKQYDFWNLLISKI